MINAERHHVFDIVANFENLQNILPRYFPSVRIRSVRENTAIVEEHLRLGDKEFIMMTKHITKYPEMHEIFVIGGDAKGTHITEKYEKIGDTTKLVVDADIKLGGFLKILSVFSRKKIKTEFNQIIDEFTKLAEN
ncbi:MAG: polyketide cyclase [Candidatus Nitrosotenuis sp.]|nr:MAG: polyketide cyclase [Candidatus Nitrosotenuis sp.]